MDFSMRGDGLWRSLAAITSPAGTRARLPILIYHRVLAHEDPLNRWDIDAMRFDAQMALLATQYRPLALSEGVGRLAAGSLPARAVCVTFDDGYADNAEVALPILRRHGVVATFFIASGYLNGGRMWNDDVVEAVRAAAGAALDLGDWGPGSLPLDTLEHRRDAIRRVISAWKYLPPAERGARVQRLAELVDAPAGPELMLRDDQVRQLRDAGMGIGGHTLTHPILTQIGDTEARREIAEGRERLVELLREPVTLFAYPNGKPVQDYNATHVRMVRDAGFNAAVSTAWGAARRGSELFQLPRFTPWDRTPARFSLRLLLNNCKDVATLA